MGLFVLPFILIHVWAKPGISSYGDLPAAEIVNSLNVEGSLMSAFRGKELVLGIGRVSLSLTFSSDFGSDYCLWPVHFPHLLFPGRPFLLGPYRDL